MFCYRQKGSCWLESIIESERERELPWWGSWKEPMSLARTQPCSFLNSVLLWTDMVAFRVEYMNFSQLLVLINQFFHYLHNTFMWIAQVTNPGKRPVFCLQWLANLAKLGLNHKDGIETRRQHLKLASLSFFPPFRILQCYFHSSNHKMSIYWQVKKMKKNCQLLFKMLDRSC